MTPPKKVQKKEAHLGVDSGGTIRAAIFGVNDGLVSIASLVMGVAGATQERFVIIVSGVAGLLAGAFSMAAGEWVSMNSQRELFEREIAIERQEIKDDPEFEVEELALIYHKRGMPLKEARAIARKVMKDPKHALDTHVREELGLNPDELGSPWSAAWSSFVAFSIGGILPVIPFFFLIGPKAIILSAGLAAFGLFTVGAFLSRFTGKFWLWSGLRMLLIGGLAAAVTYLVGSWLGVNIH